MSCDLNADRGELELVDLVRERLDEGLVEVDLIRARGGDRKEGLDRVGELVPEPREGGEGVSAEFETLRSVKEASESQAIVVLGSAK